MVGDLGRAIIGDVADRHAARAAAPKVDIVEADAGPDRDPERGKASGGSDRGADAE